MDNEDGSGKCVLLLYGPKQKNELVNVLRAWIAAHHSPVLVRQTQAAKC